MRLCDLDYKIANLVLWAGSEEIGFAVRPGRGVMARPGATYREFKAFSSWLEKNSSKSV
jgi:hypothetical protein